jgi:hypothetical protein
MRRNQISSLGETDESIWLGRGRQFSRLLAAEVCGSVASICTVLERLRSAVLRGMLNTHSILLLPLNFPLPRVAVCHVILIARYFKTDSPGVCCCRGCVESLGVQPMGLAVHFSRPQISAIQKHLSPCLSLVSRHLCRDGEWTSARRHWKRAPKPQVIW